jgi:hypothetical protein
MLEECFVTQRDRCINLAPQVTRVDEMAEKHTPEQVERNILEYLIAKNTRAGEISPILPLQIEMDRRGIGADQFQETLNGMIEKGWLEYQSGSPHIKLTEQGFNVGGGRSPSPDKIEMAILAVIKSTRVKAGEITPIMRIQLELDKQGIRSEEFQRGINSMIEKGLITYDGSPFVKLTEAGFRAM